MELGFNLDTAELLGTDYSIYWRTAWTWLADAEFRSHRLSSFVPNRRTDIYGKRLPYAPEHLLSTTLWLRPRRRTHPDRSGVHG